MNILLTPFLKTMPGFLMSGNFPLFYWHCHYASFVWGEAVINFGDTEIPVVGGIPRFVQGGAYASLFGAQWREFRKTQLDSFTGTRISATRLERCLGELNCELKGKMVLEAGCGAGRFTELLLEKGASVVSSDISDAVEVNAENCPIGDKHLIVQADINNMPFRDESFEIVICLGVIQHTPSPEETIRNLFRLVKKGGWLILDHYTLTRSHLFRLAPLYRFFLKREKPEVTIPYVKRLVKRYLPLHRKFANNRLMSILLNRVSPVISYYRAFPDLNKELQEQWALLDTHDSLTDWYKRYRTVKQIKKCLGKNGGINIYCAYAGNGVEACCQKLL